MTTKRKKQTQRERAEEWARSCVYVSDDGVLVLRTGGRLDRYGSCMFPEVQAESIRALLVATWMRARRVRA